MPRISGSSQRDKAGQEYDQRHPKVDVLQDRGPPALRLFIAAVIWHENLLVKPFRV